jgi:sec-independent protein translocase protein TatC
MKGDPTNEKNHKIPTVVAVLSQIGLISREMLISGWKYAVLIIAVLSALITPADPFSMLIAAIPLSLLYGLSILVCKPAIVEDPEAEEALEAAAEAGQSQQAK